MIPTIEVDPESLRKLNAQIEKFIASTGRDSVKVLMSQAKLLVRDLIRATPPFGKSTFSESFGAQRKIGVAAVDRDIRKVFMSLREFVESIAKDKPGLATAIAYVGGFSLPNAADEKTKFRASRINMPALERIFERMGMAGRVIRDADESIHARYRRRGRVRRGVVHAVVNERSLNAYIKLKKSHVGKAKSGWMRAAVGTGLAGIPAWIRAHSAPGIFRKRADAHENSLTVGNIISHQQDFPRGPFEAALQNRERSMVTQMNKMAEHAARKANNGTV